MFAIAKIKDLLAGARPEPVEPERMVLPRPSGKYMRGGRGVTFAGWRPALREAQDDIGDAWDDAAARVNDLLHNSGWLAGALEQCVANTVGTGLQLKALPENETFGMTPVEASDWAKTVERRFEL
jgi:hypothetical protein